MEVKIIKEGISIFTVVKNRYRNLALSLPTWIEIKGVDEIIVLDWDSEEKILELIESFNDDRLKYYRVDNQPLWLPSHSRNIAAELTSYDKILKIDADAMLHPSFFEKHQLCANEYFRTKWQTTKNLNEYHLFGNCYLFRDDFFGINGFNEFIRTYGWEDSDFYERLERIGVVQRDIDSNFIFHIPHQGRHIDQEKRSSIVEDDLSDDYKINTNKWLIKKKPYTWTKESIRSIPIHVYDDHKRSVEVNIADNSVNSKDVVLAQRDALKELISKWGKYEFSDFEDLTLDQLEQVYLYTCAGLAMMPSTLVSNGSFDLLISLYNEKKLARILELLTCLNKNITNSNIDRIIVFYDTSKDENRNFLYDLLIENRVEMNIVESRPTFESLFNFFPKKYHKNIIIANSDIIFDDSLSEVSKVNIEGRILALSRYNLGSSKSDLIHLEEGHPNYFSVDAWIFNSFDEIDIYCNYGLGTMFCDSFLNTRLFIESSLKVFNPCLDVKILHLQKDESVSTLMDKNNQKRNAILELEYGRIGSNDPRSGVVWGSLLELSTNFDRQYRYTPKNLLLIVETVEVAISNIRILHKFSDSKNWTLWIFSEHDINYLSDYIKYSNNRCNPILEISNVHNGFSTYDDLNALNNLDDLFIENNENEFKYIYYKEVLSIMERTQMNYIEINTLSKSPKISIITPSYNCEEYIRYAIESVLLQDYKNYEHIIIDGGSTDGTLGIIKEYAHVKVISEPDRGQAHAMNKGFELANGEIICYLNGDDYFLEGAFSSVIPYFENGEAIVIGNVEVQFSDGSIWRNCPSTLRMDYLRHWGEYSFPVNPVGYFYRREVQSKVGGFNEYNHLTMDLEFLLAATKITTVSKVARTLGVFRHIYGTKTMQGYTDLKYWTKETYDYVTKEIEELNDPILKEDLLIKQSAFYNKKAEELKLLRSISAKDDISKLPWDLLVTYLRVGLKLISGDAVNFRQLSGPLIVSCCYDDDIYLNEFIEHHRNLGFERFVILRFSNTKIVEKDLKFLNNPKILFFKTEFAYDIYSGAYQKYLYQQFSKQDWMFFINPQERLEYPFREDLGLQQVINFVNTLDIKTIKAQSVSVVKRGTNKDYSWVYNPINRKGDDDVLSDVMYCKIDDIKNVWLGEFANMCSHNLLLDSSDKFSSRYVALKGGIDINSVDNNFVLFKLNLCTNIGFLLYDYWMERLEMMDESDDILIQKYYPHWDLILYRKYKNNYILPKNFEVLGSSSHLDYITHLFDLPDKFYLYVESICPTEKVRQKLLRIKLIQSYKRKPIIETKRPKRNVNPVKKIGNNTYVSQSSDIVLPDLNLTEKCFAIMRGLSYLIRKPKNFNEEIYRKTYPDVDYAIKKYYFLSGYEHFLKHGSEEGRSWPSSLIND